MYVYVSYILVYIIALLIFQNIKKGVWISFLKLQCPFKFVISVAFSSISIFLYETFLKVSHQLQWQQIDE